ncbi:Phenylacetone monooxygenase [Enhygromyxa salina]|uniref:Phenylacetone monooxygenase n=1 Tax=Enhygromyxa salina TaxID=215803 RepID=A0A2S9XEG6_9BACT|nr:NAD(P)-binding domain-containing protein [Enhygromyxa salina]PRP91266.1 Phenylacetone monooxygenase [Enhygromyxa salina]
MDEVRDHLIIGAGPAGLQLGYCLQKAGRDYLILEGSDGAGSFFRAQPRHRKLISINKVYTGSDDPELNRRWDWNCLLCDDERFAFRNYSKDYFPHADDFVRYLEDFAAHYQLAIRFNTRVVEIDKVDGVFVVTDSEGGVERAHNLVVATGLSKPFIPDIPGIEHSEDYSKMSVDPMDFCGQRVLIIGKGNSAFETADALIPTTALIHVASPESIDFAWRSHYVGDLRAVNNNLLDTYQLKSQNALVDAKVNKITKTDAGLVAEFDYEHANGEVEEVRYDRVITCTGFRFDRSLFGEGCQPTLACGDKFPDMDFDWQSTNIDGLYFAGVLSHRLDYRKKQSGFIHGFRYNVECLARLLEERYHGVPYPRAYVAQSGPTLAKAILAEINQSSALWQQSGFLCSVLVPEKDGTVSHYKNMPIGYAHQRFAATPRYWMITLEFGQDRIDTLPEVFKIDRPHKLDVKNAHLSTGIHPIVRRCSHGRAVAVHHVIEDFRSEWPDPHHYRPLAEFMKVPAARREGQAQAASESVVDAI